MTSQLSAKYRGPGLLLIGAIVATALVYWPGLKGSFAFDDSTFLVSNKALQVTTLNLSDWLAAAMSFPEGSHQGRWLGMLSFAANSYFAGLDPYWFKLTNLGIHLLNGLLLFFALRALFEFHHCSRPTHFDRTTFNPGLAAAALSAIWLVLPINLTGVLYISQRLESMSNTFVFLGLWWYLRARIAHWEGRKGAGGMWAALAVATGLGVLVKESAILLPLYTACAEFAMTRGRDRSGKLSRPLLRLYGGLLLLPLIGGLVWLAGWVGGPRSYGRAFDIPQRLMTEGRVLIDYMAWTLAPSLDALTLYHDDIELSRGLLSPPTTLASFAFITGLLGLAFGLREKRPLFSLGVFWYFGGHLLTATVIPLMLAFEHRNYFPSVGLLLGASALVVLEGPRVRSRVVGFGFVCLFSFYAFTTALRSMEWSSALTLSASDAAKRPNSSAAQYEFARTLLSSTLDGDPEPMRRRAFEVLEPMAMRADADAVHNQLLIVTSKKLGLPVNLEWWESMISKLRAHPPTSVDASATIALLNCYLDKVCTGEIDQLRRAFEAATDHPGGYAQLLTAHGRFALEFLGDKVLAERKYRAAVDQSPTDPDARTQLLLFLVRIGKFDDASKELLALRALNHFGTLDARIAELDELLRKAWSEKTLQKEAAGPWGGPDQSAK